jgi:hypothetical protein
VEWVEAFVTEPSLGKVTVDVMLEVGCASLMTVVNAGISELFDEAIAIFIFPIFTAGI